MTKGFFMGISLEIIYEHLRDVNHDSYISYLIFKNNIKSIYIYLIIIELSRTMLIVKLSKWLMLLWKNTWAKERNKISKSGSFFFVTTNILWVVPQIYWMSNSALILSISIVGQILKMMLNVCLEKMEAAIIYVCTYFVLSYYPKNEVCLWWIQRVSKVFGKFVVHNGCELNSMSSIV